MSEPDPQLQQLRTLTVHDLRDMLKDIWRTHKNTKPTMTIWVDGWYEDGDPDTDDVPLKAGDLVRLSYARVSMLQQGLDGRRPWVMGRVKRAKSKEKGRAGMVYVILSNGNAAWWERAYFRKVEA